MIRHAELKREWHIFLTEAVCTAFGVKGIEKMQCQCGDDECWRGVGLKPREFKHLFEDKKPQKSSAAASGQGPPATKKQPLPPKDDVVKSRGH